MSPDSTSSQFAFSFLDAALRSSPAIKARDNAGAEVGRNSIESAMKESISDIHQYEVLPDHLVVYFWPHCGGTKFSFTVKPRFGLKALAPPSMLFDYYNPEAQAVV